MFLSDCIFWVCLKSKRFDCECGSCAPWGGIGNYAPPEAGLGTTAFKSLTGTTNSSTSTARHQKYRCFYKISRFPCCNLPFEYLFYVKMGFKSIDSHKNSQTLRMHAVERCSARRWTVTWIYSYSTSLWTHDFYSLMTNYRLHLLIIQSLTHSRTHSTPIARTRRK